MKITKKQLISFIFLSFLFLTMASANARAGWWETAKEGGIEEVGKKAFNTAGTPEDIRVVVANLIYVFLGLLGIIFLVIIVAAGYKYMNAQGDENETKEALDSIKRGVIGLLITLSAYIVARFVTDVIVEKIINTY